MKVQDKLTLDIEKLSNLGFGIAKHEGLVIFVENTCPQDKVLAEITKLNKNWATAKIVEIIKGSAHRAEPFCAMQKVCGGCQLQFINYDYQLECKKEIIEDAIKTIGGLNVEIKNPIASPQIKNYRHKVQYPISQTKVSGRILAGYYKPKSHEIVNIKHCPIQPEICDKIIEFIRNTAFNFGISGYNEKKHAGDLRNVVMRVSASSGKILVTLVFNSLPLTPALSRKGRGSWIKERIYPFAQNIFDNFKEVTGVCINFNSKKTNVILGETTELVVGNDFIKEQILDRSFKIGPNTFFQINPKSAQNIFKFVKKYIKNNYEQPLVLDAYAGVSSFGICVSDVCRKVVSVEENKESVSLAQEILNLNDIKNVELHNMDTTKFFEKELKTKKRKFDVIILDPPRKGCSEESLEYALNLCKGKIIYVSCNPATLARDLKYLTSKGAKVEFIQPFDMFCHTYHIESVAIINCNIL
ncbi:MAG TPA: 23S rRNA (uracil(1939)-C(5))-methyltransferase RlmD [Candidatus Gastranaerophilaceae bacterium]|nr:23S rRNA (uracil(1939)-C(5))-methyltransferase RlmD [Candidatus Gastranaerophilaceae bacterium]